MKYKRAAIVTLIVLAIGVSVLYVYNAPTAKLPSVDRASNSQSTSPNPDKSTMPDVTDSGTMNPSAGSYVNYSDKKLVDADGTKLLFFHAPWCPQCRALEKDIESTKLPADLTIFKVDYDSHQTLRQKYGVTIQTTLVKIDDDGNLIEKYVAYDKPTFTSVKENLLD